MDVKDIHLTSEPYLQIEPQHMWHGDALIQGNESGLRKLAAALLKAANSGGDTSREYFASDGEGYDIVILHEEKPSAFREPFYSVNVECPNREHHKRTDGDQGRSS